MVAVIVEDEGGINGVPPNISIPAPKYFVQSAKAHVSICEYIFIGLAPTKYRIDAHETQGMRKSSWRAGGEIAVIRRSHKLPLVAG